MDTQQPLPPREKIKKAKEAILKLFYEEGLLVAYDRELRYRLETQFPHDYIGEAIRQLKESGELKPTNVPGRKGAADMPNSFYRLSASNYLELLPIMRKKLDLSIFITGVSREMGRHAELAWWRAFKRNGYEVYPSSEQDYGGAVNEYKGRKASINHDIDFIASKDGVDYGIEVKNGLNYPDDLYWKFTVAAELNTIPLIIARWLNPAQIPLIEELGGKYLVYKEAIYSTAYKTIIEEIRTLMKLPVEARDEIDDNYFRLKMQEIHSQVLNNYADKKARLQRYLVNLRTDLNVRRTLGDKR